MTRRYILLKGINPEPWTPAKFSSNKSGVSAYKQSQLRAYQNALKECVPKSVTMPDGKLELTFWFWRQLAQAETGTGRLTRAHIADATNLQKATEDALQGVLYDNDREVVSVHSYIVDQGPHVESRICILLETAKSCPNPVVEQDLEVYGDGNSEPQLETFNVKDFF